MRENIADGVGCIGFCDSWGSRAVTKHELTAPEESIQPCGELAGEREFGCLRGAAEVVPAPDVVGEVSAFSKFVVDQACGAVGPYDQVVRCEIAVGPACEGG